MAAPVLIQLKPPQVGHLATHLDNRIAISKRLNKIFLVCKNGSLAISVSCYRIFHNSLQY